MIIAAESLLIDGAFTGPGAVELARGIITAIHHGQTTGDVSVGLLTPGLIDLHNNGGFGVDCATATAAEFAAYVEKLAACGVTSVLPTIITAPLHELAAAAARVAAAMAAQPGILGLHLEGPFLAPEKRGAHRADWLQPPAPEAISAVLAMGGVLKLITLAPELPGALPAISRLAAAGVNISLGHTNADAATMRQAATAGATLVTHVFNAQSALHHRAPGAPGVALTDPRLHPCLITDGLHVDPALLALAFAACPRAIAVTDSISLAGLPVGTTQAFGGAPATLSETGAAIRQDGTLAGAAITLDEGVRRLIAAGIPPATALTAATARPADALGLTDRGRIALGQRADLVAWHPDFTVAQVFRAGRTSPARPYRHDLDLWPTPKLAAAFLAQEHTALGALTTQAAALAALADAIAAKMSAGGRLFYAGAGTSGRLAVLDAAECGPTFGIEPGLIIPLLAGGPDAMVNAAEGAEDDAQAAIAALTAHGFAAADSLVGIAASGSTPFTLAALRHAASRGGLTAALINTPGAPMAQAADYVVTIASGPELITGSTRLSAGTTQKIALNILSSTIMIRLNKTYGPFMVEMRATNEKLRRRAAAMVQAITGADAATTAAALAAASMHVKTAAVMIRHNISVTAAKNRLRTAKNSLRNALDAQN